MLGISIDLARGMAALSVFLYHIENKITPVSSVAGIVAKNGAFGVPLFFVISGYCIASSAEGFFRRDGSPYRFLEKRFLRIFPAFWASIVVILLVPYFLELISCVKTGKLQWPVRDWQKYDFQDWLEIVTLTRIFTGDGRQSLHLLFDGINPVYWTLALEFQFYLVMFFALLAKKSFYAVIGLVTAASIGALALHLLPAESGIFLGYWPLFALGVGLFFLLRNGLSLARLRAPLDWLFGLLVLGIVTLVVARAAANGSLDNLAIPGFGNSWFAFAFLSAIALWSLAPLEPALKRLAAGGNVVVRVPLKIGAFLGAISYSIYLLHPKTYQIWEKLVRLLSFEHSRLAPVIIVAGTIVASYLFFLHCEKPFIHGGKWYRKSGAAP
jgi:peptidoglycan/LPS O-acetylase OafA/YrhL